MKTYNKHLCEPWFSMMLIGRKLSEGRLNRGDFAEMNEGDVIIFENEDFGYKREIKMCIKMVKHYKSFDDFIEGETLDRCLPGIYEKEEGVRVYRHFYGEEEEKTYGVISLRIGKIF